MSMWFSCTETLMKGMQFIFICHLLMLTYFLCGKYSRISILLLIIYWCWLFFMCKMVLSFSTDVYVIFWYWNILMKWMHFIFICHLVMLTYFNNGFDYLLMLTIFHAQNVLIILDWCLCDFLVLKHIDEVDALHLHLSLTYFLCGKSSTISILLLIIYWCWLFFMCKMVLSFLTDVYVIFWYWNILIKWMHFIFICHLLMLTCFNTAFDYLLMLTIFHVQNVLIIFDRCLYDFLVLKHIDEGHALHLHLSFTDVDIFLCGKYSRFSILLLIIYWCWLFFHVQNVLIILDWCLCDFLVLKHIAQVDALHLHLSLTYFLCGKYSTISILLLIIYWCWLFFMCKMFLSFSIDVYVIFLYWKISMKGMHFIFICHLLMLTYFCVQNVPQFQYCFWLFTDVDYCLCAKVSLRRFP